MWAATMIIWQCATHDRILGDRAENIEQAIVAYEQALTVMTQLAMPVDWAHTMNNLARAYYSRIRGDRAENIEQAIVAHEQALTVRTQSAMPVEWANTMIIWQSLTLAASEATGENIEQAIASLRASADGDDASRPCQSMGELDDESGKRLLLPHPRRPGREYRAGDCDPMSKR